MVKQINMSGISETEYRYERKFLVEELNAHQTLMLIKLHPALFYSPYPPRQVNSLYLDSSELEDYYDNVRGTAERKKVRLRWYGEVAGEIPRPVLEYKIKRGQVGTKHRYHLAPLYLGESFGDYQFQQTIDASDLPEIVRFSLKGLNIVLLNCYWRHYLSSRDDHYRVTLDTRLTFYKINIPLGNTLNHHQRIHGQVIVELKYDPTHDSTAQRVASFFPFRATRSSKYVQGMERVFF